MAQLLRSYPQVLRQWREIVRTDWRRSEASRSLLIEAGIRRKLARESPLCAICRSEVVTIAHIFPKGQGGSSSFWNLITLCNSCNRGVDSQILYEHDPLEAKYDPASLMAESTHAYGKGDLTRSAKLAKLAALIYLSRMKASGFIRALSLVVKSLRASIHHNELSWALDLLATSLRAGGNLFNQFTLQIAAAQSLAHFVNIGDLKLAAQHPSVALFERAPRSEQEWRLGIKSLWLPLWARAVLGDASSCSALEALSAEALVAGEWAAAYHIRRSLAWIALEDNDRFRAYAQLQRGMSDVPFSKRLERLSPPAKAEELRAMGILASVVKHRESAEYLREAEELRTTHSLRLWSLKQFPHVSRLAAQAKRNTTRRS